MQKDKPRRFVRMFQPRFARLVESGKKCQTIRPTPKRMPEPGDVISLRCWTGKPYRSKHRVLREATVDWVQRVRIFPARIDLDGQPLSEHQAHVFAKEDGFNNWVELIDWVSRTHGLPFEGILICWENKREGGAE